LLIRYQLGGRIANNFFEDFTIVFGGTEEGFSLTLEFEVPGACVRQKGRPLFGI
jgi:hypothetical protein